MARIFYLRETATDSGCSTKALTEASGTSADEVILTGNHTWGKKEPKQGGGGAGGETIGDRIPTAP